MNVFIGIVVSVIVLLVVAIGISQTTTFREFLRDEIVEIVNSDINGKFDITSIEGTLLTTLTINNVSLLDSSNQTIFYSDKINIKINPFALLTRKILLRQITFNNSQLAILGNEKGEWNLATLAGVDSVAEDSSSTQVGDDSDFPFIIQVNDLQLNNFRFVMQTFENLGRVNTYRHINFDDLVIDKFNLNAKAIADISENNYSLNLKRLSFNPNVEQFNLERFSGIFVYQNKDAIVKDFKLTSDDSNIQINARLNNADFFNNFTLEKLQTTPADIEVILSPFEFDDLSSFIPVTNLLGNKVELYLKANGLYGNLNVERLNVELNNTKLNVSGNVQNLHQPSELFLDIDIIDSHASFSDVKNLLPDIGLPDFKEIELKDFNAEFIGRPTNFDVDLNTMVNNGNIQGTTILNLDSDPMEYDVDIIASEVDLDPLIDQHSSLNGRIQAKGKGVSPEQLASRFKVDLQNSSLGGHSLNRIAFDGSAKQKVIELNLNGIINRSETSIAGQVDFTKQVPSYNLTGNFRDFDLSLYLNDSLYQSNLDFTFDANGADFNLDSLVGQYSIKLDSSKFRNENVDKTEISLQLVKNNGHRNIYLKSDFLDFTITGKFSLADAIDVVSYEALTIGNITSRKLEEFNPLYQKDTTFTAPEVPEDIISKELNFNYSFTFKNFDLIALFLDEEKLDISGSGEGTISNTKESFTIETDLDLDYLITVDDDVLYISDLKTDFRLSRDNSSTSFDDLFGSISLNAGRFYSGSDFENIEADVIFNQSRMFFNLASLIDKQIAVETDGSFVMSPREQTIKLDELNVVYNKTEWENVRPVVMRLKPGESIDIEDFSLYSDPAALFLYGIVYNDGRQNINVDLKDMNGELISRLLFNKRDRLFNAQLNIDGTLLGSFTEPEIHFDMSLDSVSYTDIEFGKLAGEIDYKNRNINVDAEFINAENKDKPNLTIAGNIPIDLNYQLEGERFNESDEIDLEIISEKFNLAALGDVLPSIRNQKGLLTTNISINGTIADPGLFGTIELHQGEFQLLANNLDYQTDLVISLDDDEFNIDNAVIKNSSGSPFNGTMRASGSGNLVSFVPENVTIRLEGDLAVLSDRSRGAQSLVYGDLFLGSDGEWLFNYNETGSYFSGNVNLIQTDLTFVAEAANYRGGNRFNYSFYEDTTNVDKIRMELEEFVESNKEENVGDSESSLKLDYDLNITTTNIAELEIILSQAVNQKLNLELAGNLNFESVDGRSRAQGSFDVLEGSNLEFFKTFEADGTVRFESDITDPYLSIVATYQSDYTAPNSLETKEVAVKIRLEGPVSELGTNLANKPENISVYVGARNIENNIPDERYDASDALSFILVNQFKGDLTAENRQELANQTIGVNTATSLLGSLLTSFVNQAVGDVVNNIQLSQSGEYTKFAVSGRFSNFKYSFGGTTELFQNINKANLRVDYFFNPNFLIRLERKDPIVRTFGIEDKITELGLKYRFEF